MQSHLQEIDNALVVNDCFYQTCLVFEIQGEVTAKTCVYKFALKKL